MNIWVVRETENSITLDWERISGANGYRFYRDGVAVSRTFDPEHPPVKFQPKGTTRGISPLFITEGTISVHPVVPTPEPEPEPEPGVRVVYLNGTVSQSQINAASVGTKPVIIRGPFSISGDLSIPAETIIEKASVSGYVYPGIKSTFHQSSAKGFDATNGQDDWILSESVFDGRGQDNQNLIWGGCIRWKIVNNIFRNYYVSDRSVHSEAIYVGESSADGLIEGNTFDNNGNTGHIFFTWFGPKASTTLYPRNIIVRNNTFGITAYGGPPNGGYYSVDLRQEIPVSSGIKIQSGQPSVVALCSRPEFIY